MPIPEEEVRAVEFRQSLALQARRRAQFEQRMAGDAAAKAALLADTAPLRRQPKADIWIPEDDSGAK
jgi:hypothetical protein